MVKAIVKTQHQDFLDTEIREFEEKELDGMKLIGYNHGIPIYERCEEDHAT